MTEHDPREFYRGERATNYDATRETKPQWQREAEVVRRLLERLLVAGDTVVDVPIGTGRFLPDYHSLGVNVVGFDISADMVEQARRKATELGSSARIEVADATALPLPDDSASALVCIRLLTLVDLAAVGAILGEAARVAPVVVTSIHVHPGVLLRGPKAWFILGKRRFGRSATRTTSHGESQVRRVAESLGLQVVERHPVNRAADGSTYVVLLLKRG